MITSEIEKNFIDNEERLLYWLRLEISLLGFHGQRIIVGAKFLLGSI